MVLITLSPHTINGQQLIKQSTAPGLTYWGERESHYGMILSKPFIQGFTSQETSDLFQALNSHDTRTGQKCHKNQKLQWWLSQIQTKIASGDCASLVIISRTSSEKQRILQASQSRFWLTLSSLQHGRGSCEWDSGLFSQSLSWLGRDFFMCLLKPPAPNSTWATCHFRLPQGTAGMLGRSLKQRLCWKDWENNQDLPAPGAYQKG